MDASVHDLEVGAVLADKYRVEALLGSGGMGDVVAARHVVVGQLVAIKVMRRSEPGARTRFLREARAAGSVDSEHVVRVSDVGMLADDRPFMVMEHLAGADLSDVLAARGPLPVAEAVDLVLQACKGIACAHRLGIVHRDIKPSNLFLTKRADGSPLVKVLDFGIAKAAVQAAGDATLTSTGSLLGSPRYTSPEQVRGAKDVDARSDVWSLGVSLHELVTGRAPFEAELVSALCAMIAADPPRLRISTMPDAPEGLEDVVRRCLAKDPTRRFGDVGAFARALSPFGDDRAVALADEVTAIVGSAPGEPADGDVRRTGRRSRDEDTIGASTVEPVTQNGRPRPGEKSATEARLPVQTYGVAWAVLGLAVAGGLALLALRASTSPPPATASSWIAGPASSVARAVHAPPPTGTPTVAPVAPVQTAEAIPALVKPSRKSKAPLQSPPVASTTLPPEPLPAPLPAAAPPPLDKKTILRDRK